MNKIIFGCKPSVLTGKEPIYSAANSKLPVTYSYLSVMPPIKDQGQAPKCVAYSTCAWLDWRKNIAEHDNNGDQFDVDKIYNCRADKSAQGMQIIEAMHFLKNSQDKLYHIKGYAKVGSIEQLKSSLIANGPALCGMPVRSYNSDFWNGNQMYGGHCLVVVGYNDKGFIIRNSWGQLFGNNGYTLLPYSEFNNDNLFEIWTIFA